MAKIEDAMNDYENKEFNEQRVQGNKHHIPQNFTNVCSGGFKKAVV